MHDKWLLFSLSMVELNVDRSCMEHTRRSGCSGLIRFDMSWLVGYSKSFPFLWAIKEGPELA